MRNQGRRFAPSNSNLKVLTSYEGDLGEEYWSRWEKNPYRKEKRSFIKQDEIRKPGLKVFTPVNTNIKVLKDHKVDLGGEEY